MVKFHETLSEQSVYMRYFHMMNLDQRTTQERLTRICFIDYDREMALVAVLSVACAEGLRHITADILFENYVMQHISKRLGFRLRRDTQEMVMKADLDLYQPA